MAPSFHQQNNLHVSIQSNAEICWQCHKGASTLHTFHLGVICQMGILLALNALVHHGIVDNNYSLCRKDFDL